MDEEVALYEEGDLTGRVTGSAPRSRVRALNLPHAATAVMLRDARGRVYVHRRTETKDLYPGMHDVWAGGVVLAGEDPVEAASRELTEELGVHGCELRDRGVFWYRDEHTSYLAHSFEALYDPAVHGPVVHQPEEVSAGWWMDWDEFTARLADPEWPFVPDGRVGVERCLRLMEQEERTSDGPQ
ncbi:NUDIX hydrolase [Wenjunlia tyrosinilytica]|nr:NUDIX domain-containing protein [Wenjunlia tyrosinilytica]